MRRCPTAFVVVLGLASLLSLPAAAPIATGPGPTRQATATATAPDPEAPFDVDAVVEAARHRIVPSPADAATLVVDGAGYRARFDADGFGVAGLDVALSGVRRDGVDLDLSPRRWRADGNVATRRVADAVRERVTAGDGDVEWDVVLDRPLPGEGDLVVTAAVGGVEGPSRPVDDGRSLAVPVAGTAGARMGELVVVDARSAELHRVLPRVEAGEVRLVVPARVLDRAAYPLTLDPTIGPETTLADPGPAGAPGEQTLPDVAGGPTGWFVVWTDDRQVSTTSFDVFGTRVSSSGQVLDPAGIPIGAVAGNQFDPTVAWNVGAGTFLVAWQDTRGGGDLYGARVGTDGVVLDPGGRALIDTDTTQRHAAVASDGTNWALAWEDAGATGTDVRVASVTPAGTVPEATFGGWVVNDFRNSATAPALAWADGHYMVVWEEFGDIFGQAFLANTFFGLNQSLVRSGAVERKPAIARAGGHTLVVWEELVTGRPTQVLGTFLVQPPRGSIPIYVGPGAALDPDVTSFGSGAEFLVTWHHVGADITVQGARVRPVFREEVVPLGVIGGGAGSRQFAAVGTSGARVLAAWTGPGVASPDVSGRRLELARGVLDPPEVLLSTATTAPAQLSPDIAWSGSAWLVVWADSRNANVGNGLDIYGITVDPSGRPVGQGGPIFTGPGAQTLPAVAWGGGQFLVVWSDNRTGTTDIYGTPIGGVGSHTVIPISTAPGGQFAPAVAWDGANFLVAWQDGRPGSTSDIYARNVNDLGLAVGLEIPVSTAGGNQSGPAVAGQGSGALVVWKDRRSGSDQIVAARVSSGAVLDPAGVLVAGGPAAKGIPGVAFDGTNHLVVWDEARAGTGRDVLARRVGTGATLLGSSPIVVTGAPGDQDLPAVAAKAGFLVVWRDRRSSADADVYGARVSAGGEVDDPAGVPVAATGREEHNPAVAGGPDTWAIAYLAFLSTSDQTYLRTWTK